MSFSISQGRISKLCKQSPIALGAIAVGAGALSASAAQAEVIIINNGFTVETPEAGLNFDAFSANGAKFQIKVGETFAQIRSRRGKFSNARVFKGGDGFTTTFAEGSDVGPDSGKFSTAAFFYENDTDGPFGTSGDTGYIGFFVEVLDFVQVVEINALEVSDEAFEIEESPEPGIYYGWAEVTRGSLTVNRVGLQSIAGAAAPIPFSGPVAVSEPATLPLIALGAAGLAALRRRKK